MDQTLSNLTGNAAVLKKLNTVRVLNRLRLGGSCSRAELARATGLDAKTITNVCNSLLKSKLIQVGNIIPAGRGRPAEEVELSADAAMSIGVDLGASHINSVLIDLKGSLRGQYRREFAVFKESRARILRRLEESVEALLKPLEKAQVKKIVGIGFCFPGFVDRKNKTALSSVNIKCLENLAVGEHFGSKFETEIFVEESSRSMALAERWFGGFHDCRNFVTVDMGFGIGIGIVQDGLVYRGANECSGEIGHTVVEPYGSRCQCGKQGCLETIVSGHRLAEIAESLKIKSANGFYGGSVLHEAADRGNKAAADELARAGHYIGVAIANVINLFDPADVILNGGLTKAGGMVIDPLRNAVKAHTIGSFSRNCEIKLSTLGDNASALGTAMLPLRHYFEFENIRF